MLQAKQLTETTWMLSDAKTGKSISMVNFKNNKFVLLGKKVEFETLDEVALSLGSKLQQHKDEVDTEVSEAVTDINGYPVKHPEACEFETQELEGVKIETYRIKAGYRKVFAAGYYGLKFKNGYVTAFCPLFKTLVDNGFIGPYNNQIDMEFHVNKINKGEAI
jgi:hypothetical protein